MLKCGYSQTTRKFQNCTALGLREFYTRAEIEAIAARLSADTHFASPALGVVKGLAVGSVAGMILGGILAPFTGGATFLIAMGLGASSFSAYQGYEDYSKSAYRNTPILNGVARDHDVTLEMKQYNFVVEALKQELDALE